MNKKHKPSISRQMYWSTDVKNSKICPKCGSSLEKEYHSYVMLVRIKKEFEHFAVGTDGGYFCPECPVVVLDRDNFIELASVGLESTGYNESSIGLAVAGIVDMDAVPEDKKDKPLGTEDNPIPLVPFSESKEDAQGSKKTGKNQTCPCGSGKKYKKCCGRL
ncbi:MAG: SEC-C domain-containing protein [Euryarchaeota archaeon]|nr:SEC-C domain-containing protein [Euryarchaeota archaeon]